MIKEMLQDVKVVFVTDVYDQPLAGHAWYQGKYCFFDLEDQNFYSHEYRLWEWPRLNTLIAIADRKLFEDMVGYHWTAEKVSPKPENEKFVSDSKAYWNDPYILNLRCTTFDKQYKERDFKKTYLGSFIMTK